MGGEGAEGLPGPQHPCRPASPLDPGEQVFQGEALTWTGQGQLEARGGHQGRARAGSSHCLARFRASPLESDASG